jgi:uncharacterized protein
MMDVNALIERLGLQPHPAEGGYFVETYRSVEGHSTAIYYLLTPDTFSAMHRLSSDEIFHFYAGDPVEMLQLLPHGPHRLIVLGSDVLAGQQPQVLVPKGAWQGSRLAAGGEYALLGTTVAPAFRYQDYEHGECNTLIELYPDCADLIRARSASFC